MAMTTTFTRIETPAGFFAVRFISSFAGRADYGIQLCRSSFDETRLSVEGGEILSRDSDRLLREYGFTFEAGSDVLRRFLAERFDSDVREIVRLGSLEYADQSVRDRAAELSLV